MHPATIVSLTLGASAVFQAALNRRVAATWGLAPTIFLNGIMVLLLCVGFLIGAKKGLFDALEPDATLAQFQLLWLLPGVLGFMLITGLPWAIGQIGATQVFVGVVFAQMATSLAWDVFMEGIPLSWTRVVGAVLCGAGVMLASWEA